jgi:DNA-binding IclR family transcriptional regulator
VAAPVFGHEGTPVGVISVSGPAGWFRAEVQTAVAALLAGVGELSRRLGYRGPAPG